MWYIGTHLVLAGKKLKDGRLKRIGQEKGRNAGIGRKLGEKAGKACKMWMRGAELYMYVGAPIGVQAWEKDRIATGINTLWNATRLVERGHNTWLKP